jgi:hypothetical protein
VVVTINIVEGVSKNKLITKYTMPNVFFFCLNDLKANTKRVIPAKNNTSAIIRIKIETAFTRMPPAIVLS